MAHHCCSKHKVKRGLWSPEEDEKLAKYVTAYGHGCWSSVPKRAGLQRCGKSCRLRWINYLRPDLKRGCFSLQEERAIIDAHRVLGNRWAQIAKHLPGRTDNEVKNFWNSCIKKRLIAQGIDPKTHGALKEDITEQKKARCSSIHQRNCLPNTSSSPHDGGSPFHGLRLNGNITEANASTFLYSGQNVLGLPSYANPVVGDWMGKPSPSKHISNPLKSCANPQMMKPLEQVDFQSNDGSSRHDANVHLSGCNIPRGSSSWHLDLQSPITHSLDQNDGNLDCAKRSIVGLESMNTPSLLFSATETNQYDVLRPHFPINLTELGPHDQPTGSLIDVPSYGPSTVALNDQIYMSNHNYSLMSARLPKARYAESSESGAELAAARDQEQCATANITVQLPQLCDLELDQCNSVAGETTDIQFPSHAHIHDHFGLDLFDSSLPVGIYYENNIMHNALTQWGS